MLARKICFGIGITLIANSVSAVGQDQNTEILAVMNRLVLEEVHELREKNRKVRQDPFSLTKSKTVQKDLDLIADQISQLELIETEFERNKKRLRDEFSKYQRHVAENGPPSNKEYGEYLKSSRAKKEVLAGQMRERKKEVLLPHQIKRLNQIAMQVHVRDAGEGTAIVHPDSAKLLGITNEQKLSLIHI